MAKIELEVDLLVVTNELEASAGDRLIVFDGKIIGVLPRNEKLPRLIGTTISAQGKQPMAAIAFDEAQVRALLECVNQPKWTAREINKALGWTNSSAGNMLSRWLSAGVDTGMLSVGTGRYPQYWLNKETK